MRVAVIGTGTMGGMHARLLADLPEVAEVVLVDADDARAASLAREIGGTPLTQDEAMASADAVVIATPAPLHAAPVEAAVRAGIPALCEKPLTDDLASSRALVETVERSDAHVEMGFQRRHDAAFVEARRRVLDGGSGRIHLLRLTAFDPVSPERPADAWEDTEAAPVFLHSSVHDFDLARWLIGSEVVEVAATGTHRDGRFAEDPRDIETAAVTMRMANGTLATLEATWLHPGGYDVRAEIVADRAHLTMGLSGRTPADHLSWPDTAADPWPGYLERFADAYRAELVAFLAAARGEGQRTSSVRDGFEALRIAIAATRAHVERRTVSLSEVS